MTAFSDKAQAATLPSVLHIIEATAAGTGQHVIDLLRTLHQSGLRQGLIWSPLRADNNWKTALSALSHRLETCVELAIQRSLHPSDINALSAIIAIAQSMSPPVILHGHSTKAGFLARLAAAMLKRRHYRCHVVYTPHAFATYDKRSLLSFAAEQLERLLVPHTDLLIAVSTKEKDEALRLGYRPHQLRYIPNGIDQRAFLSSCPDRASARTKLRLRDDHIVITCVGRLSRQKNQLLLVRSVSRLLREFPEIRVILVGSGPMHNKLRICIQRLTLTKYIQIRPPHEAKHALAASDIVAIPSLWEGLPYVALEAAALGKPIVITPCGGALEVVQCHPCSTIAKSMKEGDYATATKATIQKLRRYLSTKESCHTTLPECLTLERMARVTLAVYLEFANRCATTSRN